jgi:hypothetical protein
MIKNINFKLKLIDNITLIESDKIRKFIEKEFNLKEVKYLIEKNILNFNLTLKNQLQEFLTLIEKLIIFLRDSLKIN